MKRKLSLAFLIGAIALFTLGLGDQAFSQVQDRPAGNGGGHQYGPFDLDGDGIPNGLDADFVRPLDGSGRQLGKAQRGGNGVCGIGPRNGSGFGRGRGAGPCTGDGVCDGTGPKGKGRGR